MSIPTDKPLLTLTEAARRLGVHPATLRRWSDKGQVDVVITPGGHRRFPIGEIERLASKTTRQAEPITDRFRDMALTHTREEIAEHQDERWMSTLDESERAEKRTLGRRLMTLMMQYISGEDDDSMDAVLEEAEGIGAAYGTGLKAMGLPLTDALQATMFFRDNIVESAVMLPGASRRQPATKKRMLRRINEFLNAIQLAIATAYEDEDV